MRKVCDCGLDMNLGFRHVIFEGRIQIENVPILECEYCSNYEVISEVKPHLLTLLKDWRTAEGSQLIYFNEYNEIADLLYGIFRQVPDLDMDNLEGMLNERRQERINLLLDLYGYAKDNKDDFWMEDVKGRLCQLTQFAKNRQKIQAP
ncbi:hypothetical protein [Paenibacillus shirakamiensis]|uniref:hypothetical protein n=1 Tax=Paenibacillus shirakamiensis TaxID=1265935 RepID=UPI001AE67BB2